MRKILNAHSKYLKFSAKYKVDPTLLFLSIQISSDFVQIVYTYLLLVIFIHIPLTILKVYTDNSSFKNN